MTVEFALIEHALQGLTMDVVINLTEHVQTLELRPSGQLFTAYRDIDQTLLNKSKGLFYETKAALLVRVSWISGTSSG